MQRFALAMFSAATLGFAMVSSGDVRQPLDFTVLTRHSASAEPLQIAETIAGEFNHPVPANQTTTRGAQVFHGSGYRSGVLEPSLDQVSTLKTQSTH